MRSVNIQWVIWNLRNSRLQDKRSDIWLKDIMKIDVSFVANQVSHGVPGQVWYLSVPIPNLYLPIYFVIIVVVSVLCGSPKSLPAHSFNVLVIPILMNCFYIIFIH